MLEDTTTNAEKPNTKPTWISVIWKGIQNQLSAILLLWLPTFIVCFYYFFIATDIYESEARFLIHSPNKPQFSGLSTLIESAGIVPPTQENLFAVHDYISSRDVLPKLQEGIDLREVYSSEHADAIAAYPNLIYSDSNEGFYKYFNTHIDIVYNSATSITTLKVRAFSANDAHKIANLLLQAGEDLVNRLNERSSINAIKDAQNDLALAEDKITDIQLKMLEYRNKEAVLDPKSASAEFIESISRLRSELILSKARLSEIKKTSPNSPLISSLKNRISAIQNQYLNEQSKLTGNKASLAPKVGKFEELVLRQEFAAQQLASATLSLESAKAEARRQQIYLDRVVEPSIPDAASHPQKLKMILTIFISFFLLFSTSKLMLIGLKEHSQR